MKRNEIIYIYLFNYMLLKHINVKKQQPSWPVMSSQFTPWNYQFPKNRCTLSIHLVLLLNPCHTSVCVVFLCFWLEALFSFFLLLLIGEVIKTLGQTVYHSFTYPRWDELVFSSHFSNKSSMWVTYTPDFHFSKF